jgi:plastocyanin
MRFPAYAATAIVVGFSSGAIAASKVVYQHGRAFSEELVVLKAGEALTFVNDDTVPHNIYSATRGNEFDLGSQAPGTATDIEFTEVGEVDVLCAIHPRMTMRVKVIE